MPSFFEEFIKELPKNVGRIVLKCHRVLANFVTEAIEDYKRAEAQQRERQRIEATKEMLSEAIRELYDDEWLKKHIGYVKVEKYRELEDNEDGGTSQIAYTEIKPVVQYRKDLLPFPCEGYAVVLFGKIDEDEIRVLNDQWHRVVGGDGKVGVCVGMREKDDLNNKLLVFLLMDKDEEKKFTRYRHKEPRLFL